MNPGVHSQTSNVISSPLANQLNPPQLSGSGPAVSPNQIMGPCVLMEFVVRDQQTRGPVNG
jgi:hypothetical protein